MLKIMKSAAKTIFAALLQNQVFMCIIHQVMFKNSSQDKAEKDVNEGTYT
jgi:hypothetical protein